MELPLLTAPDLIEICRALHEILANKDDFLFFVAVMCLLHTRLDKYP